MLNDRPIDASGNVHVVGGRNTIWKADASGTAGPGTAASFWILSPAGVVVSTFDSGGGLVTCGREVIIAAADSASIASGR